jgi:SAM-dependent methyltransferase
MPPKTSKEWDARYQSGETPWDSQLPSRELIRVLTEAEIAPCRTLELGCGAGTNAVYLAKNGFDVTAVDMAPTALDQARRNADSARVDLELIEADICDIPAPHNPFEFVFDRGCFHCVRSEKLDAYLQTLARVAAPGARVLILTGNANEVSEGGPPGVREEELRAELSGVLDIERIREFHFEDRGGLRGPLGWSCLGRRAD